MDRGARGQPAAPARGLSRASLAIAVLLAAAGTAVLLRDPDTPPATAGRAAGSADAAGVTTLVGAGRVSPDGDRAPVRAVHPLQRELVAMAHGERVSVLRLAIRDRSLECADVAEVVPLADGLPVWRVACSGARAYIVEVDGLGRIEIEPQFYHEPSVVPPTGPAPDDEGVERFRRQEPFDRGPFERFR